MKACPNDPGIMAVLGELSNQPMRYCLPLYFMNSSGIVLDNGTITLLDAGEYVIGITAFHCLTGFNKLKLQDANVQFYIGSLGVDPNNYFCASNDRYDLATLKFPKEIVSHFRKGVTSDLGSMLIKEIYRDEIEQDQFVTFGGFPGGYINQPAKHDAIFHSSSFGPCMVTTAGPDGISCRMEEVSKWNKVQDNTNISITANIADVGGLSGGPLFVETRTPSGIWHQQFAGIIYESIYFHDFDLIKIMISPARLIHFNGSIDIC